MKANFIITTNWLPMWPERLLVLIICKTGKITKSIYSVKSKYSMKKFSMVLQNHYFR